MSGSSLDRIDKISVTRQIVDALRGAVLDGKLAPGSPLREVELAKTMGVSRGSIREALIKLEGEGLVVSEVGRGSFVPRLSSRDVGEIYDLRLLLEKEAVRLVSGRISPNQLDQLEGLADKMIDAGRGDDVHTILRVNPVFHALIWEWSGNQRLWELLERYYNQVSLYLAASLQLQSHDQRMRTVLEHRQIVDSMRAGRSEAAMAVMHAHLEEAERLLRLFMTQTDPASHGLPPTD